MEIQRCIRIVPKYHNSSIGYLLSRVEEVSYTGFFVENNDGINDYYFKIGNDFYIVKAKNYEELERSLVDKLNSNRNNNTRFRITSSNIGHSKMSLYELIDLYKYNNKVRVDDYFITDSNDTIKGSKIDYLNLVKNIILLEKEIRDNHIDISNKYALMKFLYDKYKMIASYWDPVGNYGNIKNANHRLLYDSDRVVRHPYSFLGLINDNYATCEGMARGLVELFRYFGIDATIAKSELHGVCKIMLKGDNGERRVTYIDLSREVTTGFQDNKYEYVNGIPILRHTSNRRATINSNNFFLKRDAGIGMDDPDYRLAVDFEPRRRIRIISIENNNENMNQRRR